MMQTQFFPEELGFYADVGNMKNFGFCLQKKELKSKEDDEESEKETCDSTDTDIQATEESVDYLTRKGLPRKKKCASCMVRKTPYWRDGWDPSILLCNACGIRYQKYKKFCLPCKAIARKDEKGRLHCPNCLEKL